MKTNPTLLFISSLLLSTSLLRAEIKETVVEYKSGDTVCEGLHVVDTAKTGKLPSVLIVHQWTGLSDNEKMDKDPQTDLSKVAAIGYCFGGTGVIELARSGALIKGVVSFHGGLDSPTPADGKNIKGKVLALHGADDPFVKAPDIAAFEQEMKDAKVDYKLVSYPGAVHSFTQKAAGNDNSKGAAYNEAADKASWEEMKAFFARIFKTDG
jgi:dienelactone hydrolase